MSKAKTQPVTHFFTKVVGVTQENSDGSDRQRTIRRCRALERVELVREPRNRHDRNAVMVCRADGDQLGYLGAEVAADVAAGMKRGQSYAALITAITGGTWTKPTRGVNLAVVAAEPGTPDQEVQDYIDVLIQEDMPDRRAMAKLLAVRNAASPIPAMEEREAAKPIELRCGCGRAFQVPAIHAGKRGRCPDCKTVLPIPAPSPEVKAVVPIPVPSPEVVEAPRSVEAPRPARGRAKTLTECPDCGAAVSRRAETCPQCGGPMGQRQAARPRGGFDPIATLARWGVCAFILIFVTGALLTVMSDQPPVPAPAPTPMTTTAPLANVVEGLPVERRKEIYAEDYRLGMLATYRAEAEVPVKDLPVDPAELKRLLEEHRKVYEEARASADDQLSERYGITPDQVERIAAEGAAERWPLPDVSDPYR